MENASKALIMAAGVLLGIMVLSLASYLFITFSNESKNMEKELFQSEIAEFNNNFLKYNDQELITTQDLVTMINFARNQEYWVQIIVEGVNYVKDDPRTDEKTPELDLKEFLKNYAYEENLENRSLIKWEIKEIDTDTNTGRINKIIIKKK